MTSFRPSNRIPLIAAILASAPALLEVAQGNRAGKFSLLAPDAFYYFTVARNISRLGLISFDQEHPTNGFHPLWQALMAMCYWAVDHTTAKEDGFINLALILGAACTGLGVYLVGRAAELERRSLSALFVAVPFGCLSLLFPNWAARWTSVWSSVNGMETSVVLLFYGLAAWLYVTRTPSSRSGCALGSALALLTLSRLDHGIFAALIIASIWWEMRHTHDRRYAFAATLVWTLTLAIYVVLNKLYCGMWLPVSGSIKSTFPGITQENFRLLTDVITGNVTKNTLVARSIVMFVPMLFAAACVPYMVYVRKKAGALTRYQTLLVVSALGIVGLALYNILYVPTFNIGRWYFPVSTLFTSLMVIEATGKVRLPNIPAAFSPWILVGLGVTVVVAHAAIRSPKSGSAAARFYYDEAPKLIAHYKGRVPKLVDYDDGIVAFATGAKALSGWGLVLDREAAEYVKRNRGKRGRGLIDVAIERGYARIATLTYSELPLTRKSSNRRIRRAYRHILAGRAKDYKFRVEYLSRDGEFSIVVGERAH